MVGIGPGGAEHRSPAAEAAIAASDVIVGYTKYVDSIPELTSNKDLVTSGMTQEIERGRAALERAASGQTVALISSGDAGIYGMAGLALELASAENVDISIEIVPGITAASAAAAVLGAPLMLDFAVISLSDLLVSWEKIRSRLLAIAQADMVAVLYNPRSKKRVRQLDEAVEIFRQHREETTPVGVVTAAGCEDEKAVICALADVLEQDINMRSVVIVGNSTTQVINGRMVTSRGYQL